MEANLNRIYALLPSTARKRITPLAKAFIRNASVTRLPAGFQMDLDPDEWLQNQLRSGHPVEPLTIDLIGQLLESGHTYVDVGAHVGYLTLAARLAIGATGKVIAVEPQPYNCSRILRNWSLNDFENIVVYPAAASDEEKTVTFHEQNPHDRSRLSLEGASASGEQGQQFCVPARRLESILTEQAIASVGLMKIDAESHELPVVKGLGARLATIENLIIEVWDPAQPYYQEMFQILAAGGFEFFTVTGQPWAGDQPLPELNLWAARPS